MRFLKYVAYVIGLIAIALIAAPFFISSDQLKEAVEQAASEAVGMPVQVESLTVSLLPKPSLVIRQLVIRDVKGGVPKLSVASGSLAVGISELLEERIEISGIAFKDVVLRISEKAKGKDVRTIRIDQLTGAVKLARNKLTLPNWKAELYGGKVHLDAKLMPFEGKKRTLSADVKIADIQMLALMKDAAGQNKVSGTFDSTLHISAVGKDEKSMKKSLKVDGPIVLTKGSFEGIGLSGIAATLVHGSLSGADGVILFDSFKTQLKVRGQNLYLKDILLDSSAFDAEGQIAIKASGKLSGQITTSGLKGLSGAKLLVGGTTNNPKIYPAPSSLLGATVGGVVGGPVGAAIGSKVGSGIGNVFEDIGSIFGK